MIAIQSPLSKELQYAGVHAAHLLPDSQRVFHQVREIICSTGIFDKKRH